MQSLEVQALWPPRLHQKVVPMKVCPSDLSPREAGGQAAMSSRPLWHSHQGLPLPRLLPADFLSTAGNLVEPDSTRIRSADQMGPLGIRAPPGMTRISQSSPSPIPHFPSLMSQVSQLHCTTSLNPFFFIDKELPVNLSHVRFHLGICFLN